MPRNPRARSLITPLTATFVALTLLSAPPPAEATPRSSTRHLAKMRQQIIKLLPFRQSRIARAVRDHPMTQAIGKKLGPQELRHTASQVSIALTGLAAIGHGLHEKSVASAVFGANLLLLSALPQHEFLKRVARGITTSSAAAVLAHLAVEFNPWATQGAISTGLHYYASTNLAVGSFLTTLLGTGAQHALATDSGSEMRVSRKSSRD